MGRVNYNANNAARLDFKPNCGMLCARLVTEYEGANTMPARTSRATWKGNLQEGSGTMALASGAYEGAYTNLSRFQDGEGTNPEELLGAAHAGCFSMALAARLAREGYTVNSVETTAKVNLERGESGFKIARIDLVTRGSVEGIDETKFKEAAEATKTGCIVSQALSAVPMTIDAALV
jgi:osmotically inducible protein OsmC